ncbi:MAG TPA: hypothetical protein DHW82_12425 [Spirochaetia bacterium]|nr:MAG: hypothetical protein A2Y41_14380 [Spirochaetes bacterium GWB1_36_13]HCL57797.1 hypothetical protein [Spirochaetia bacterium]
MLRIFQFVFFIFIFLGSGFLILNKNLELKELEKKEKKIIQNIYEVEEERRYGLYELEKLKNEGFSPLLENFILLNAEKEKS